MRLQNSHSVDEVTIIRRNLYSQRGIWHPHVIKAAHFWAQTVHFWWSHQWCHLINNNAVPWVQRAVQPIDTAGATNTANTVASNGVSEQRNASISFYGEGCLGSGLPTKGCLTEPLGIPFFSWRFVCPLENTKDLFKHNFLVFFKFVWAIFKW